MSNSTGIKHITAYWDRPHLRRSFSCASSTRGGRTSPRRTSLAVGRSAGFADMSHLTSDATYKQEGNQNTETLDLQGRYVEFKDGETL